MGQDREAGQEGDGPCSERLHMLPGKRAGRVLTFRQL